MNKVTSPRTLAVAVALSLLSGCGTVTLKNVRLQRRFGGPPYSPRREAKLTKGVDLALVGAASIGSFEVWTEADHDIWGSDWGSPSPGRRAMSKAAKLGADFIRIGWGEKKATGKKPVYLDWPVGQGFMPGTYIQKAPLYHRTVYAKVHKCSLYRIASDPEERRRIRSKEFVWRMKTSDSAESAAKLLEAGIADSRRTMNQAMGALLTHLTKEGYCHKGHSEETTRSDYDKLKLLLRSDDVLVTSIAYWMERVKMRMAALGKDMQQIAKLNRYKKEQWDLLKKVDSLLADALNGRRAGAPLIAALKDQDRRVRRSAAAALGKFRDKRAVEPLIAALRDQDRGVRSAAARGLGRLGWSPASDLQRAYYLVALGKCEEAGKLGPPGVEALIGALTLRLGPLRPEGAALRKIGSPAIEALIAALETRSRSPGAKPAVARLLGELGDKRAVQPLIAALKDQDPTLRSRAAWALGKLGDKRAVEPLVAALKEQDRFVRYYVAAALGEFRDKRAVEPLIAALKDQDRRVRRAAAWALGDMGPAARAAIPALTQLSNDKDSGVRTSAASALKRMSAAASLEKIRGK